MKRILLMNGPNLDMLGTREPEMYGHATLRDLEEKARAHARSKGISLFCFQSNSEAALIEKIHGAIGMYDGIVYNPGAHTHYSYALRDAVAGIDVPVIEVHLTDVDSREAFRAISVIAPACVAVVKGLGFDGYCHAIDILCDAEGFVRLGEGYERRYPAGSCIIGGRGAVELPESSDAVSELTASQADSGEAAVAVPGPAVPNPETSEDEPEDFAAPYAVDIAADEAGETSFRRLGRVRSLCGRMGIAALLVRDTSNIRWASAFDGVFDEERAHALLINSDRAVLHTDSRYSNAMRSVAQRVSSDVLVNDERMSHADFAWSTLTAGGVPFSGRMGIEDSITYSEYVKMADTFGTSSLAATTDLVLGLRAVKDQSELSRLLAAQAVTDAAFVHIVKFMRPGMTEREVQIELENYMLRHGGEGLAFSSIVATGANGADPHAIPGSTRLEAGQCVVMDFGAKAFGYCSDMTRMVFLGQPDGEMAQAWQVLRNANETVQAMLRPGVTGKEAHETAERVLAEGGFAGKMGHGLGHGVGIDVHELPVLNPRNDRPLVEGNVVTVEPGIYLPGKFGMRLEDCGVVTQNGYEVFSQLGHEMVVI